MEVTIKRAQINNAFIFVEKVDENDSDNVEIVISETANVPEDVDGFFFSPLGHSTERLMRLFVNRGYNTSNPAKREAAEKAEKLIDGNGDLTVVFDNQGTITEIK